MIFQREPPDVLGGGSDAIHLRELKKLIKQNRILSVQGGKLKPDPCGGFHLIIAPQKPNSTGSSSTSTLWMYPDHVELDPTLPYSKGRLAYISPANPLVTTGMKDAISGLVVQAFQGIYEAVVDVPPQTTDTPPKYNVPLPQVPQGAVSGTPLKGDFDSPTIFWRRWPQDSCF